MAGRARGFTGHPGERCANRPRAIATIARHVRARQYGPVTGEQDPGMIGGEKVVEERYAGWRKAVERTLDWVDVD